MNQQRWRIPLAAVGPGGFGAITGFPAPSLPVVRNLSLVSNGDSGGSTIASGVAGNVLATPNTIGNAVVLIIKINATTLGAITAVTSPMGTFIPLTSDASAGLGADHEVWICRVTTGSSRQITVTGTTWTAAALEISGTPYAIITSGASTASSTAPAATGVPGPNDLMIATVMNASATALTGAPGAPWNDYNGPDAQWSLATGLDFAYQTVGATPAASLTAPWAIGTATRWSTLMVRCVATPNALGLYVRTAGAQGFFGASGSTQTILPVKCQVGDLVIVFATSNSATENSITLSSAIGTFTLLGSYSYTGCPDTSIFYCFATAQGNQVQPTLSAGSTVTVAGVAIQGPAATPVWQTPVMANSTSMPITFAGVVPGAICLGYANNSNGPTVPAAPVISMTNYFDSYAGNTWSFPVGGMDYAYQAQTGASATFTWAQSPAFTAAVVGCVVT